MVYKCIQRFDVMSTVRNFLETKHGLNVFSIISRMVCRPLCLYIFLIPLVAKTKPKTIYATAIYLYAGKIQR